MAQTPRTLAELLALLPDNTTGLIGAEDIRDLLVSLYPSRGEIGLTGAPVATTFANTTDFVKVAGATAIDPDVCSTCVTMPASATIQLTKPVAQVVLLNASLAVLPAANNKQYSFTFAKNGTPILALKVSQFFGPNLQGRPAGLFLSGLASASNGDTFSVVVRSDSDTTAITASTLTFSVLGFIK
jgi:hypothetical protein